MSPDQVLSLAPDASAAAAARATSNAAKWASAATNGVAVWGEALGSGKNPYQTAVDLKDIAYKCSCPSRKLPCKHALGLLLRLSAGEVPEGTAPAWVDEWLEKRAERSAKQVERATAPQREPDPDAALKRTEKRWKNILAGIEECESFLSDAVSQGLLAVQSARSWDQMAARMVDAQAPGIAIRLKRIGANTGVGTSWAHTVAGQLGSLALLMEAAKRVEVLEDGLQADVRVTLGIPTKKEDLSAEPVYDVWDVLGQTIEVEDRLSTCRSWLKGRSTGRWAMHLTFSVAGQPYDFRPIAGSALSAGVQFFPSAWPLRTNIGEREIVPFDPSQGTLLVDHFDLASLIWASNPWAEQVPVHLRASRLGRSETGWSVIDESGQSASLTGPEPWSLLAMSGNRPCEMLGEWNGVSVRLLGAWSDWGYLAL